MQLMNPTQSTRHLAQIGLISVASLALFGCNKTPETTTTTPDSQTASALASQATASDANTNLSLIHISEPTRPVCSSRMPSSA